MAAVRSAVASGGPSAARGLGFKPFYPLPQVLSWRGLLVVLAKASWPAAAKLPPQLDDLLGPDWVAVKGDAVPGVEEIAAYCRPSDPVAPDRGPHRSSRLDRRAR